MPTVVQVLEVHGPLGILALLGIFAAAYMYKELRRERKRHGEDLKKERAQHRSEINQLIDRILSQGKTQNEKYHALAEKLHAVVDSALRLRTKG